MFPKTSSLYNVDRIRFLRVVALAATKRISWDPLPWDLPVSDREWPSSFWVFCSYGTHLEKPDDSWLAGCANTTVLSAVDANTRHCNRWSVTKSLSRLCEIWGFHDSENLDCGLAGVYQCEGRSCLHSEVRGIYMKPDNIIAVYCHFRGTCFAGVYISNHLPHYKAS